MELLITMALASILAAIAFPSFREFNTRMRVSETTNDIVHAMHLARAEAAKRGQDVVVASIGGGWTFGWEVRIGAEILLEHGPLYTDYTIETSSTGGGMPDAITFRPTGSLLDATSFDFNVCRPAAAADTTQSRRVTVTGDLVRTWASS
jgi:type IV fimbrial biogenesis protein FimT